MTTTLTTMTTTDPGAACPGAAILSAGLARDDTEIAEAQRLRYRVFSDEWGAKLASRSPGRDEDVFDPWCEHLVVRDERRGAVVGTYRVLTAERARRVGSFYSETEFDLTSLARWRDGLCEIGRACVDPAYRGGTALLLLWQAIADLMRERGSTHLIGCASAPLGADGGSAIGLWRRLVRTHLAPGDCRVAPRRPLLVGDGVADTASGGVDGEVPALMRGYLRMGAWIGGDPARDDDFGTADFFMILPLDRMAGRYARHYRKAA